MQALEERDYFSDHSILKDPYAYFEAIRAKGPIYRHPVSGIVMVTGFDEAIAVLNNEKDFSSVIATQGAAAPLPFEPKGSDITSQIDAHRSSFLGGDLVIGYDELQHSASRSLLSPLFTPSRLRANEEFIVAYSDHLVKEAVAKGGCELMKTIATPFVTMVVADLLGVPVDDRQLFMDAIEAAPPPGSLNSDDLMAQNQPLIIMGSYFVGYVQDRRENPRDDILSELANAKYPDGTTPDALEIVRLATFLFGAGQDTSAKLLGNAMRFIIDQPGLQARLRQNQSLIPQFLEEVLRLEGSVKMTTRLARRDTRLGDLQIPAGTKVMIAFAAANRDPRRWENPEAFDFDRPKLKEHLSFGRGPHVCAGAPLARVEVRIILEKFLAYTSHIDLDEAKHGPKDNRNLDYDASFIIRGLSEMHLKLTPAPGFVAAKSAQKKTAGAWLKGLFGFGKPAEEEIKDFFGSKKKVEKPAGAPQPYSTAATKIGALLADPAAKALLDKHFPGVSSDPKIGMGKNMTLRTVQKFAADVFTDGALDALDADLARLQPSAQGAPAPKETPGLIRGITGTKLVVNDLAAAEKFYQVLGLKLIGRNIGGEAEVRQEQSWLSATGDVSSHMLILSRFTEFPPQPRPVYPCEAWLAIYVEDVDAALRTVQAAGGTILRLGQDRPEHQVRAAVVCDTEGHVIEVVGPMLGG